jgi:hypothetical protein
MIVKKPTTVENGCPFTAATCPEGHYCPGSGGEAILCPIGKYGNAIGKTTLNTGCPYTTSNCPKGHYCPSNTHGEALPCPPGKYGNVNGKTTESNACTTSCPSGRYGNIPGQTSQSNACPSVCSSGRYGVATGKTNETDACQHPYYHHQLQIQNQLNMKTFHSIETMLNVLLPLDQPHDQVEQLILQHVHFFPHSLLLSDRWR